MGLGLLDCTGFRIHKSKPESTNPPSHPKRNAIASRLYTPNSRDMPPPIIPLCRGVPKPCKPQPHPTPYTLLPTPYTLYTLHPTPYTLHPTPYTLHPTPKRGLRRRVPPGSGSHGWVARRGGDLGRGSGLGFWGFRV